MARAALALALLAVGAGCGKDEDEDDSMSLPKAPAAEVDRMARQGRLEARPAARPPGGGRPGLHELRPRPGGAGLLQVPDGYSPARPPPLVIMLHGAGSNARSGLELMRDVADERGLMLLAPEAHGRTWDAVRAGFGPDVSSLDALLGHVFERFAVDRSRVALGGFSDGASYALSLGLRNGDLFSHLIAFSPGFVVPGRERGRPSVYVSHGIEDRVLPIDRCSRIIVPDLRRKRYDVDYREFAGGHAVPSSVVRAASGWLERGGEPG